MLFVEHLYLLAERDQRKSKLDRFSLGSLRFFTLKHSYLQQRKAEAEKSVFYAQRPTNNRLLFFIMIQNGRCQCSASV
jgi:hypothetical protein